MAVVGYPATLSYFSYYPFWRAFLEELKHDLLLSPPSSRRILDLGVLETVSDACVPIKLAHGHALALASRVDFLLVPRFVSVRRKATFCPKFLGLPDMLRATLDGLPPLLDNRIDLAKGRGELRRVCGKIGARLGAGYFAVGRAYRKARRCQREYQKLLLDHWFPLEAFGRIFEGKGQEPRREGSLNLAVLGYPYQVHDPYISVNLLSNLERMGVNVWTAEMVPEKVLLKYAGRLPKELFWQYSRQVVWATYYYQEQNFIDGIIHVTAFGCGPDAMVDKIMELETRARGKVPFMSLAIDEQTGEAATLTRLEAFVDMIRLRRGRL